MRNLLLSLSAIVLWSLVQTAAAKVPPEAIASGAATATLIVTLDPAAERVAVVDALVRPAGGAVVHAYDAALYGMAVQISADAADALRAALMRSPAVSAVEAAHTLRVDGTAAAGDAPWHLDRIDQRQLPLDGAYDNTHPFTGAGVNVYVVSSGIRISHTAFGGRAAYAYSAVGGDPDDCNGIGTYAAGLIGGADYGVAPGATLHAVRVTDCIGAASSADLIAGLDWVTANHVAPAAGYLNVGGASSPALAAALEAAIDAGVQFGVVAGNSGGDACATFPGGVVPAVTTAYTNAQDAAFGNQGPCVDLFAPGVAVTSAWINSDTSTITLSSSSGAAALTAGALALGLDFRAVATPLQLAVAIRRTATPDVLAGVEPDTANRLLYTQGRVAAQHARTR